MTRKGMPSWQTLRQPFFALRKFSWRAEEMAKAAILYLINENSPSKYIPLSVPPKPHFPLSQTSPLSLSLSSLSHIPPPPFITLHLSSVQSDKSPLRTRRKTYLLVLPPVETSCCFATSSSATFLPRKKLQSFQPHQITPTFFSQRLRSSLLFLHRAIYAQECPISSHLPPPCLP